MYSVQGIINLSFGNTFQKMYMCMYIFIVDT